VSFDTEAGHRYQKHHEGQSGQRGGKKPEMRGVIALPPGSGELRSLAEDDNHNGEKTGGNDCLKEGTSAVCVSRSVMLVWWREGRLFRQNGSGGR
jgi:hypothetical protein